MRIAIITPCVRVSILLSLWIFSGCQAHSNRALYLLPVGANEVPIILSLKGDPTALKAYMDGRPKMDIAGAAFDGMETVGASLTVSVDPVTGVVSGTFSRNNDISARAPDLVKAGGDAFAQGANAAANLAGKVGAGMATGGGSTLLDTLVGAAVNDPALLETAQRRLDAVRKLTPPKIP